MKFKDLLLLIESQESKKLEVGDHFFLTYGGKSELNSYKVQPHLEIWVNDDHVLHRTDGPAYIFSYPDGDRHCSWHKNGLEHRIDGPSDYLIDKNGNMNTVSYYINGKRYSKEDFDEFTKGLDNKEDKELLGDLGQTFN